MKTYRNSYPILDLIDKIPFGKFKGYKIEEICKIDGNYILYLSGKGVVFTKRTINLAKVEDPIGKFKLVSSTKK
jgi:hypothetical protein